MHHQKAAPFWRRVIASALSLLLVVGLSACSAQDAKEDGKPSKVTETSDVVLASTTSTEDSGLFKDLIPAFEADNPHYRVKVIAVGTGEALKMGETKDADVLLVHAKADEEKFVEDGFGVERRDVMYNDFVLVGPETDPAGVKSAADQTAVMKALEAAGKAGKAVFISRGDDSGTHKKELKLWGAAGITTPTPQAASWYESTGQGMGETLKIASEKAAYTLVDRATYLSMKDSIDLVILREGDKGLLNQYGVIVVTDAKNQKGGQAFADWIVSEAGQKVIADFGVEQYGQPLFVPDAR